MLKLFGSHDWNKILEQGIQGQKLISTPFGQIKNENLNFLCETPAASYLVDDRASVHAGVVWRSEVDGEVGLLLSGVGQGWSLTQLYSVDFSQSKIGVKKCVFNKRTIKVCVSWC